MLTIPIEKSEPPLALLPWLSHQESLTEKLRIAAGGARLQVLSQHWGLPNWWDKYVLQLAAEPVMHREIAMWAEDVSCWYARTILPRSTYVGHEVFFDRLKNESLGQLIFNNSDVKRTSFINYAITPQCIEYHWLSEVMYKDAQLLWLRLSTFTKGALPFFLVEILLPGLMRYAR